jgi:hypothetical protein
MGKKPRKGSKENPLDSNELSAIVNDNEKEISIVEASIKDDYCNYKYEILKGVGIGFKHKVEGRGIIEDDLKDAFNAFDFHLAAVDDVFKHSGTDTDTNIETLKAHELTRLYNATGFKITGGTDAEFIQIIGNKYVSSAAGRIELTTPKVALDNLSSYKWYLELKAAADKAREEVLLYHEGKYTMPAKEEVADKSATQMDIGDAINEAIQKEKGEDIIDAEFENAQV